MNLMRYETFYIFTPILMNSIVQVMRFRILALQDALDAVNEIEDREVEEENEDESRDEEMPASSNDQSR